MQIIKLHENLQLKFKEANGGNVNLAFGLVTHLRLRDLSTELILPRFAEYQLLPLNCVLTREPILLSNSITIDT